MSILPYILLGLLAGAFFPIQATINARLRTYAKTPLTASFIAFSVGSVILFITLITFDAQFYQRIDFSYPITVFLGGAASGLVFNVANIVLFAKIGATLTTLVTITGQMIMGIILDHFGVLDLPIQEISILRLIGVILMIIAIIIYQNANLKTQHHTTETNPHAKYWIVVGLFVGIFPPLQAAFNGQLRLATHSILTATFLSFFIGAIMLAILVFIVEKRIKIPLHDAQGNKIPLWIYTGGVFGIIIVGGTIVVIHQLGAVLTSIVFILGQLLMAVFIDQLGLFGLAKRTITYQKTIALLLMFVALIIV